MKKQIAFVITNTDHGTMIVNRNDFHESPSGTYGVGCQLLSNSSYDLEEVGLGINLLDRIKKNNPGNVIALDCGANIGVLTIEWAKFMTGWGEVYSFEAQEKIFYALAGNIAINNLFNVHAYNEALGANDGFLEIPTPNYQEPGSFGSFELKKKPSNEFIGQEINYEKLVKVKLTSIDSLEFDRIDLIKIDVEGMEDELLLGAKNSIKKHKPVLIIEIIKSDKDGINRFLAKIGYKIFPIGMNILAVHEQSPILKKIQVTDNKLAILP